MKKIIFLLFCVWHSAFASNETNICIQNNSDRPYYITVSNIDSDDWDGNSRPDKNFNGVLINPAEQHCEREEVRKTYWAARFTFVLDTPDGSQQNSDMMLNPSKGYYWMSKDRTPLSADPSRGSQDGYTEGFLGCPSQFVQNCRVFKITN